MIDPFAHAYPINHPSWIASDEVRYGVDFSRTAQYPTVAHDDVDDDAETRFIATHRVVVPTDRSVEAIKAREIFTHPSVKSATALSVIFTFFSMASSNIRWYGLLRERYLKLNHSVKYGALQTDIHGIMSIKTDGKSCKL